MLCWCLSTAPLFENRRTCWVLAKGGVSAEEQVENVDCLTAKKRVKKCDAKCLLGLAAPQTLRGHEVCMYVCMYAS